MLRVWQLINAARNFRSGGISPDYRHPSNSMRQKLTTVGWITLGWSLIAIYQFADGYAILLNENAIGPDYDVGFYVRSMLVSVLLGSFIAGTGLVFLWDRWLRVLNFRITMLLIVLFYTVLFIALTALSFVTFAGQSAEHAREIAARGGLLPLVFNPTVIPNYVFWLFVLLATVFVLFVRDRFGPGMLAPYIMGKYFSPVTEEKVVMFLDLKDSTQTAERLGAQTYFGFLNEVFRVVTPPILQSSGHIHQYVGDEIVIAWSVREAARDGNCLECFWRIDEVLTERAATFEAKYGCTPSFKAGLNAGSVVAGEVGVIKREVVYSGDVLNTAARIEGLCGELDQDLLVSESVKQLMDAHEHGAHTQGAAERQISFRDMGAFALKGKANSVHVYAPSPHSARIASTGLASAARTD